MPNASDLKKYLSVAFAAVCGAVLGYIGPIVAGGVIPPENQWKSIGLGALGVGISALVHLYQAPPSTSAAAMAMRLGPPAAAFLVFVFFSGCTPAQYAKSVSDIEAGLSDAQKACVAGEAMVPVLGLPAPAPTDVALTCALVNLTDETVVALVALAAQAQMTVAAKVTPLVAARRMAACAGK